MLSRKGPNKMRTVAPPHSAIIVYKSQVSFVGSIGQRAGGILASDKKNQSTWASRTHMKRSAINQWMVTGNSR